MKQLSPGLFAHPSSCNFELHEAGQCPFDTELETFDFPVMFSAFEKLVSPRHTFLDSPIYTPADFQARSFFLC